MTPFRAAVAFLFCAVWLGVAAFRTEAEPTTAPAANAPASPEEQPPTARDVINESVAGNEQVQQLMRTFEGKGDVGDDSLPTDPGQALRQFQVRDDLELELVAAEPEVRQPLFMTWDERGRLWVVQYLQYPFPAGLKIVKYDEYLRAVFDKVPAAPPRHVPGADRITVFEDTDGDGRYDSSKDVLTGLNIASSVAPGGGGLWVLNPPYLLFYPDADGDDVPDGDPEVHLSGFGLEDTHSIANSLRWGPDGWLYAANGSTTTGVIDSAVTKGVAFQGQMVWRYHPRTKEFEIFAEGGGNTFGVEIDAGGRIFSGTNHGNTRGMYYVQGGYGRKSWGKHGPLTNPYAFGCFDHLPHEGFRDRFTHSVLIYEGGLLPADMAGKMIAVNPLHRYVTLTERLPDGSSFRMVDLEKLVTTEDRWFRPVDVKTGPDGAVYIADWYDTRLTHVDPRDNWHKSSGRIYRLRPKGTALPPVPNLRDMTDAELIALFEHPNRWYRFQAVRLLGERADARTVPRLETALAQGSDQSALGSLWALNGMEQLSDASLLTGLEHASSDVRRWAVRLIGDRRKASAAIAGKLAELAAVETDAEVRAQLACSAKRLPAEIGLPLVRRLTVHVQDAADPYIPLLIWWAIEAQMTSHPDDVLDLFKDAEFWSRPVIAETVLSRVMQRFAMTENFAACEALLALAPEDRLREPLIRGFLAAFQGRRIDNLPEALARALETSRSTQDNEELLLRIRLGEQAALDQALTLIRDSESSLLERLSCVELLGEIHPPGLQGTLLGLLRDPYEAALQRAALTALAHYPETSTGQRILAAWKGTLSPDSATRLTALRVLAGREEWARLLLREVDTWQLDRSRISLDLVQLMKLHQQPDLDALIEKHWGRIRESTSAEKLQEIQRIKTVVRDHLPGDAQRGEILFEQSCGKCHRLFERGGLAGPDLTGYERSNLDFLLLSIIDPSASIREEYTSFGLILADGRTLTGLIEEQDPHSLTLRDPEGNRVIVDREQVETLQAMPVSLMPEGLLEKLSEVELRDLFAYVMSRTAPRR